MFNDKNKTWKGLLCNLVLNNSEDIPTYIKNINSNHQDRTQNVSHFTKSSTCRLIVGLNLSTLMFLELRTTFETFWQTTKIEKVIFRHFLQKLETFFLVGLLNKNWWDIIQPWILQKKKKFKKYHCATEEFVHSIDKQTILNIMSINN
jgi:hypothetical protein